MKGLNVVGSLCGVVVVGLGVAMSIANPGPGAYEEYAAKQVTRYLNDVGCEEIPILKNQCLSWVKSAQPQIADIISQNTERQNFFLFSIYKTKFDLKILPTYQFETVGALQNFYIYKQEKQ